MKNELLPLRTVVQVLFFEQERAVNTRLTNELSKLGMGSPSGTRHNQDLGKETLDNMAITEVSINPRTQHKKFNLRHAVKKFIHHLS